MTQQIPPNADAMLLRQVGEVLFGSSWQTQLANAISVSDRSMRRWVSGEDAIPPGVWRDIHYHARSRHLTIKYFDDEIARILEENQLKPIPNTRPMPDSWGLHFALATASGRPVRCFIRREVLDDRVSYRRMKDVFDYFETYADVFYRVAQRKFDAHEIDGNLISINNDDIEGEGLPDIRNR
ncbi:hypothetical protein [Bradyrhizobium japonicum]|uniref:hypothetical protein n=1 Tax=Bradyrhizobium japonicum TaxID=375 RepID=UPI001BA76B05|nr:hypothetical protein [Bradyrhizobium japonicum]MBR0912649.1 hypothetical protein [Bradyrhizobium japonicum]